MQHELKLIQPYFNDVYSGTKPFELRKNDRDFKVGDTLLLQEWSSDGGYTGNFILRTIAYVLKDYVGIEDGYCILGLDHRIDSVKEEPVDRGYLEDWYINSVSDSDTPIWATEHLDELFNDFILIPKENN